MAIPESFIQELLNRVDIIDVIDGSLTVRGMVEGLTREELQSLTGAPLKFAAQVAVLKN